MLYSKLFGKTKKGENKKFESKNQELLIKAGFIDQVASGIYTLLPLGNKVHAKIEKIIREELDSIGAQELLMPSLHPKNLWEQTGRWQSVDVLFKTKSRFGQEYALGPTHEEIITPLAKKFVQSYKDLPLALYHITTKFRDEPRPKSGILRGREFIMKDLYSFHSSEEDLKNYYQTVLKTYLKIFQRIGFEQVKITEASGGSFTKKHSHEFNVLTKAGEVDLLFCDFCSYAQNQEIATIKKNDSCPSCQKGKIHSGRGIEIGNIFDLGTKFSQDYDLYFIDKDGQKKLVYMGCYGIGTTRILGALVELYHDGYGIIWPKMVTPYHLHLIGLDLKEEKVRENVLNLYQELKNKTPLEILFDDRDDVGSGEKLIDADLIGIPLRLVVSKKTGDRIEVKERNKDEATLLNHQQLFQFVSSYYQL